MYKVEARDAKGLVVQIGPAGFASIDLARGFAVGISRWMLAVAKQDGRVDITSDGQRIEGATVTFWAQSDLSFGQAA